MIRTEHLNHHHNLYAGQAIEWMVESSFIAMIDFYPDPEGILFKNCHKFEFNKSIWPGEIVTFESMVVRCGSSSVTVHVDIYSETEKVKKAEGVVTFVTTKPDTNIKVNHGLTLDETDDETELAYRKEADSFFRK